MFFVCPFFYVHSVQVLNNLRTSYLACGCLQLMKDSIPRANHIKNEYISVKIKVKFNTESGSLAEKQYKKKTVFL